ncbi:MAG TPA: hypothetical protein VFN13_13140 [Rudaea sp.]|nr:hypothetical protein [Rudaea sp.]
MSNKIVKPLTLAIGVAFLGSAALSHASQANTAFQVKSLVSGYMLAGAEGKCSEGKCAVSKMDTNKDHKISMDEAKVHGWNEAQFKAADANHDGSITKQEMAAAHKMHKKGSEGSCSAAKKGAEGSCSAAKKKGAEGSCSAAKKKGAEGSCSSAKGSEGSCGAM